MPKRTDIKSILIIGAGPIIIGQACEFDYSGRPGLQGAARGRLPVILVNSNPATIMTDPETADVTYIEPIPGRRSRRIIEQRSVPTRSCRPWAARPRSTARSTSVARRAQKYGVEMIGAPERRSTRPRTARSSRTR